MDESSRREMETAEGDQRNRDQAKSTATPSVGNGAAANPKCVPPPRFSPLPRFFHSFFLRAGIFLAFDFARLELTTDLP
jgi:hypothetical protein